MMRVAVAGATGMLGGALCASLMADGHQTVAITRRPRDTSDIEWDPQTGRLDRARLEGLDAVVHVAGEPLDGARWTARVRERIRRSRVDSTRLLADCVAALERPPGVFVVGTAVGYYGDAGDREVDESSPPGDDFMASLCVEWEAAAGPAREAGIRVAYARTGVVLARGGPLIEKVELPFSLGLGGRVGSGRQFVPWISLADHSRGLRHIIDTSVDGPVNLVGPRPVTNAELTSTIGDVMRRPTVLPIPMLAIRLVYGEMGVALASVSQRVVPRVLREHGFEYRYPDLHDALAVALSRRTRG